MPIAVDAPINGMVNKRHRLATLLRTSSGCMTCQAMSGNGLVRTGVNSLMGLRSNAMMTLLTPNSARWFQEQSSRQRAYGHAQQQPSGQPSRQYRFQVLC